MRSYTLATYSFPEQHTGDNIVEKLKEVISEYDINPLRTVVACMRQGNKLDYHAQTNQYNFAAHHPTNLKLFSFCSVYSAKNFNILGRT